MLDPSPTCTVHILRLDATLAELRLELSDVPSDVEVRGRLMGPRCPGTSTIEVAYHLKPLGPATFQVLIPEPSMWEAQTPFVYEGPVEFWRDGERVGRITVSVGLRQGNTS
jgi:hypothetical protein